MNRGLQLVLVIKPSPYFVHFPACIDRERVHVIWSIDRHKKDARDWDVE